MCENCNIVKATLEKEKQKLVKTINFWRPIVLVLIGAVLSASGFYFETKGAIRQAGANALRIDTLERANIKMEVLLEHVSKQLGEIRQDVKEIKRGY